MNITQYFQKYSHKTIRGKNNGSRYMEYIYIEVFLGTC